MENCIPVVSLIFVIFLSDLIDSVLVLDYGYSAYCQPCISPCAIDKEKGKYQCRTYDWTFDNKVYDWDYCSPDAKTEYSGANCTSACAFHGEKYQWCSYGTSWGYCSGSFCTSQKEELPDFGYSTYCQPCITPCSKVKERYYWCSTKKFEFKHTTFIWDYCSPNSGVDYLGNSCLNKCTFRGQDFQWCKTEQGGNTTKSYCSGKGNVLCDFLLPGALN